ncbi:C40 family peptidase [Saccharothrix australiensis]|uniref:Cell wall-associated NlpC family hydrolase n=1 Tax=Saccharothrix australiensis TaxID=2072 RepID=A0A495W4S9_9PSEU|nr:C40 family peptidase [Saccharothrix australiensis]RKT54808.1 hypothetical protein C8E97_3457 [Saccharothrix australiensis]
MRRLLFAAIGVLIAAVPPAQAGAEPRTYGGQGPAPSAEQVRATVAAAEPITRAEVVERARSWLNPPVPYDMKGYKDGWRTDCSGYVSMAWKLDSSLNTETLPDVSHRIEKDDLRAGDVLMIGGPNTGGVYGHATIFERWTDETRTRYWAFEQTEPQTVHREIPYPYFDNDTRYLPYRYNLIVDGPVP